MTGTATELKRLRAALAASGEIAYHWDLVTDRIVFIGEGVDAFGRPDGAGNWTGKAFAGRINPEDLVSRLDALARHQREGEPYDCEYRVRGVGGEARWVHDRGAVERSPDGQGRRMHGTMRFITERKHNEAELKYLANHDELTGHYNRSRLRDALDHAIKYSARYNVAGGFLMVGIDKLTAVNAAFGHEVADRAILMLGRRFEENLRASDTIGRVDGDRFGIVLTNCPESELARACEKLLDVARNTVIDSPSGPIHVTVSIGAVEFTATSHTTGDTMTKAGIALQKAKLSGRDCFSIYSYSEEQRRTHRDNIVMVEQVKAAVRDNRLRFAYQPIVDAKTRQPAYYECLMRKLEDDGSVRPAAAFMPAVEKLGLVRLIDRKALELAVETIEAHPDVSLAINVSGLTATDRSWLRGLVATLRGKPAIAERLAVEITETAVLEDIDECARFVLSLKDLGCRVALDDFGAGYTSISQLKTLAVDVIKIDGSFVRDLVGSPHNLVFVRTILDLAKNLDIETVAECVETEEAAELLVREGVDYMQGYAFGHPTLEFPWVEPVVLPPRIAKAV